jgi:predicted transposase YbfD/YdcC
MREYGSVEKSHGRIETRIIRVAELPTTYLEWNGVCQVIEIERTREKGSHISTEIVYAITSLSPDMASAKQLHFYARRHWSIENELHNIRDVAFGEDHCRVRNRRKAQILAAIRNTAITLLRRAGFANITEGREWCSEERVRPIHILLERTE